MALAIQKGVNIDTGGGPFCRKVPTVLENFPETVIVFYTLGQFKRIPNDGDVIFCLETEPCLREWCLSDGTHDCFRPTHSREKVSSCQRVLCKSTILYESRISFNCSISMIEDPLPHRL